MLTKGEKAPDFEANTFEGKLFKLSEFSNKNIIMLVFIRGFI